MSIYSTGNKQKILWYGYLIKPEVEACKQNGTELPLCFVNYVSAQKTNVGYAHMYNCICPVFMCDWIGHVTNV